MFELGLLDLKCHLVDILDRPGGQCTELYPEKPIYDIPGLPMVTGQELTNRLLEQIKPFDPQFHFSEMATSLEKLADGKLEAEDRRRHRDHRAGGGGRGRRRLASSPSARRCPASRHFENAGDGIGVHYAVRKMETFRGKNILIAGGGDSALDWVINLAPLAKSHDPGASPRRLPRRRRTASTRCASWRRKARSNSMSRSVKAVHGEPGKLTGVTLAGADKSEWHHEADAFLPFFGLTIKLGPIAEFGINLHENLIPVDTARFESQTPGIFAIGDINTYTGKLKLILSGFHEAALMAQAAFHICRPNEKLRFQYTTSSSNLQKKLGCLR